MPYKKIEATVKGEAGFREVWTPEQEPDRRTLTEVVDDLAALCVDAETYPIRAAQAPLEEAIAHDLSRVIQYIRELEKENAQLKSERDSALELVETRTTPAKESGSTRPSVPN